MIIIDLSLKSPVVVLRAVGVVRLGSPTKLVEPQEPTRNPATQKSISILILTSIVDFESSGQRDGLDTLGNDLYRREFLKIREIILK
jgi:hypothetical protein